MNSLEVCPSKGPSRYIYVRAKPPASKLPLCLKAVSMNSSLAKGAVGGALLPLNRPQAWLAMRHGVSHVVGNISPPLVKNSARSRTSWEGSFGCRMHACIHAATVT